MKILPLVFWLACAVYEFSATGRAYGHGFAGARFFPATLSTDDPFVADELSLPTVSSIVTPDGGGTRDTEISSDIALRITPKWDIEFGETFITLNPSQGKAVNGFDNLSIGSKYEFFENDEHEAVVSLGLGVDVGGTGSKEIGADLFLVEEALADFEQSPYDDRHQGVQDSKENLSASSFGAGPKRKGNKRRK